MRQLVTLSVNGSAVSTNVRVRQSLASLLRDTLLLKARESLFFFLFSFSDARVGRRGRRLGAAAVCAGHAQC